MTTISIISLVMQKGTARYTLYICICFEGSGGNKSVSMYFQKSARKKKQKVLTIKDKLNCYGMVKQNLAKNYGSVWHYTKDYHMHYKQRS